MNKFFVICNYIFYDGIKVISISILIAVKKYLSHNNNFQLLKLSIINSYL